MAINKIDQPGSTAPTLNTDYTQQNEINVASYLGGPAVLTSWADTGTEPDIENGTYISYAGNIYQVQGGDENITGTMTEGLNYVILTTPDSGSTLTAAWGDDLTGYTYNEAYQGLYNTGALVIQAVCVKTGSVYTRGISSNTTLGNQIQLADGGSIFNGDIDMTGDMDVNGDVSADNFTGLASEATTIPYTSTGTITKSSESNVNFYSSYGAGFFVISWNASGSGSPAQPGNQSGGGTISCFVDSTRPLVRLGSGDYTYWKYGG